MKNKPILIKGTVPETAGIGGVTIHIDRLLKWMNNENVAVELCDYKKESILSQLNQISKHNVIHIHASNPVLRFFYTFVCFILLKKSIFTVHGNIGRFSKFKNLFDKLSVKICTIPIVINKLSFEKAIKWNNSTILMSAFIPPYETGYLPINIENSISNARSLGKTIYATNASARSFDKNNNEIYGIDFLISFFKEKEQDVLIISDPSKDYSLFYEKNAIPENIIFINEQHSFYALIQKSDIVIRGTSTDGDSISIKEALYAQKKVIATDCVDRPSNVILYTYNDINSLGTAIETAKKVNLPSFSENPIPQIKDLYNNLNK